MKRLIVYFIACIWCWAPLVQLRALPLHLFLRGATVSTSPIEFVGSDTQEIFGVNDAYADYPPGVLAGDIVIVVFATDTIHNASGTPPAGWTKLDQVDAGTDTTGSSFWKRLTVDGEAGETFTDIFDAPESGASVTVVYRNCIASGSPINASSATSAGSSSTWTGSVTPTIDNSMVVALYGADAPTGFASTWISGNDERADYLASSLTGYITAADKLVATAAPTTMQCTNAGDSYFQFIYALSPK